MPVTVRDVCTKAFRKLGVLRAGGEMRTADAEDARASLESFYQECIAQGTLGQVRNIVWDKAGLVSPGGNQHVNITTDEAVTVDLPTTLPACHWDTWRPWRDYGWGLNVPVGADQNVTVPRDRSVVQVTNEFSEVRATYVYDGTVQRWMRIDAITLNDEAPLSARGADGLASVLAVRLSDEYGASLLTPGALAASNRYKTALATHFGVADEHCC